MALCDVRHSSINGFIMLFLLLSPLFLSSNSYNIKCLAFQLTTHDNALPMIQNGKI